jgi:hypothetical protein
VLRLYDGLLLDGAHDHLGGREPVRVEQVGLVDVVDQELVGGAGGGTREEVVEEVDLGRGGAVEVPGRPLREARGDGGLLEDALLLHGLPHGRRRVTGPRHEHEVRTEVEDLLRERRELVGGQRYGHGVHVGAEPAEHRLDTRYVRRAELRVLHEHDHGRAVDVVDQRRRRRDVLVGLAAGAEGVAVDTGDGVGGGRAGDEEDVVLLGQRGDLHRGARGHGARDDGHAPADEVDHGGHGPLRVAGVVDDLELDRAAVDSTGAVGRVVEPRLEAVEVVAAVGAEQPACRGDDPDRDRLAGRLGVVAVVGVVIAVGVVGGRLGVVAVVGVAGVSAVVATARGEDEREDREQRRQACTRGTSSGPHDVSPIPVRPVPRTRSCPVTQST